VAVKTKTHFQFRIDIWDDVGGEIVEHVADYWMSRPLLFGWAIIAPPPTVGVSA
jgi:hypothetical protein